MTNSQRPLNSIQTIDLAATFNNPKKTPYVMVFVALGTAPFDLGGTEFTQVKELPPEISTLTTQKGVKREQFAPHYGRNALLVTFQNKAVHTAFMEAVLGRHTDHSDRVVQVGGKSPEWYHVAGQYIAYENRARREADADAQMMSHSNVSRFGGTLVNFSFPDLATMRAFCERVNDGTFDLRAKELRAASQNGAALKKS